MTRRQSAFAYVALLLGVITFASSFVRPTSGQQGSSGAPGVGRFQVSASANTGGAVVFVTDTTTGKTWFRHTNINVWTDLGTPAAAK
jgi:hypothetical protein